MYGFAFSALTLFAGFTVTPYITIYMQTNAGLRAEQILLIYLFGGAATLVSSRWVGRMTDRFGKFKTFRLLAVAVVIPLVAITLLRPAPFWQVLVVTTLFFVCMSARMIPGMAMLTSAAQPRLRGTFMTFNSAVQSAAMGAALTGGWLMARDPQGQVSNYWVAAVVGGSASLLATVVASRLDLRQPISN